MNVPSGPWLATVTYTSGHRRQQRCATHTEAEAFVATASETGPDPIAGHGIVRLDPVDLAARLNHTATTVNTPRAPDGSTEE